MTTDIDPDHPYPPNRAFGDLVFMSGIIAYDEGGQPITEFPGAIRHALGTLAERLSHAGCGLDDVLKATVFVTDIARRDDVNVEWQATFRPPMPVRTLIEVSALPSSAVVELDVIAGRTGKADRNPSAGRG